METGSVRRSRREATGYELVGIPKESQPMMAKSMNRERSMTEKHKNQNMHKSDNSCDAVGCIQQVYYRASHTTLSERREKGREEDLFEGFGMQGQGRKLDTPLAVAETCLL